MLRNKLEKILIGSSCLIVAGILGLGILEPLPAKATEVSGNYIFVMDQEETQVDQGPVENKVTLYESYSSAYDLYEESMDDLFFFYCNVGNGAFSSQPVEFEIPGNITYVLEKDGVEIPYQAGTAIALEGNYVVRLSAEYEEEIYTSTFRFSIRNLETEEAAAENETDASGENQDIQEVTEEDLILDENEDISEEELDTIIENAGEEYAEENGISSYMDGSAVNAYTGFAQVYSAETGYYGFTLQSGEVIEANIPNGAIVNAQVAIKLPDSVTATVYKDGVETAVESMTFADHGFYKIVFTAASVDFERFYTDEAKYPYLTFRIVTHAVNDIEVFNAPENCKITAIKIDDSPYSDSDGNRSFSYDSFWLSQEGAYTFTVYDNQAGASYDVKIKRDITAPEVKGTNTGSQVSFSYVSNDIASAALYKDGVLTALNGTKFSGKGNYTLYIYDYAGNYNVYNATLKDAFNGWTFAAIALNISLVIALILFLKYKQSNMKVR